MSESRFDKNAPISENIISFAEGNPGALTVLTELFEYDELQATLVLSDMEDMNLYGSRIWIGYKDYCGEDIEAFADAVLERNEEMVEVVNDMRSDDGEPAQV